jgi:pimeloyl-ACP methyl ester carboxylesterase
MKRWIPFLLSLAIAGCGTPSGAIAPAETAASAVAASSLDGFMDQVFTLADTDKNGALSIKEADLLLDQFQVFDKNRDGALSRAEWAGKGTSGDVAKAFPLFLPMVLGLHAQLDTNKNRLVSLPEVRQGLAAGGASRVSIFSAQQVDDTFSVSDKNRDGGLSGAEFQNFYLDVGTAGTGRGFMRRMVMSLLGTYLQTMGRIAAPMAVHPAHNPLTGTPARYDIPFETVSFKTEDGLTLKGWLIPAKNPTKKTLVMAHGITATRSWIVDNGILPMVHDDYNVVAFDLRNHGESEGTITSFGLHEGKDVVAAVRFAQSRGWDQIALYGVSLGGASVIRGAALLPEVKAVIDDCAYATVSEAMTGFISLTFVPCPVLVAKAALVEANKLVGGDMTTTEPLTQVAAIAPRPFLVIHGAEDKNVAVDNSRINYAAAGPNLVKELWVVPGGEHAASVLAQPKAYAEHLQAFLKKVAW